MDKQALFKWLKTAGLAALGGGIAGAFAAMMDPTKYSIAHDIGSGKLWKFFFMGALTTFGALLLKSPLGKQVTTAFKDSQQTLKDSQAEIAAAQADLKASVQPAAPEPSPQQMQIPPPSGPTPPAKK